MFRMTLTLYCQLLNHVMEKLLSSQRGALHVLYNQRSHVHRLLSIYVVPPLQIIDQLEQITILGDQEISWAILRSTNNCKSIMWQRVEKRVKSCTSTTTNWRTGIDNTKRSSPIWIYGLLWIIPRMATTQRRLFIYFNLFIVDKFYFTVQ